MNTFIVKFNSKRSFKKSLKSYGSSLINVENTNLFENYRGPLKELLERDREIWITNFKRSWFAKVKLEKGNIIID